MPALPEVITHEQILTSVKQRLRLTDSTDHDIWLLRLIDEGVRNISSPETIVIHGCETEVTNNAFMLPANAKSLKGFRTGGNCVEGVFIDTNFFESCGCRVGGSFPSVGGSVKVNGRTAWFNNAMADGVTVDLAFTALNREESGRMVTTEEQQDAATNYACYVFAVTNADRYLPIQIGAWEKRWNLQSARCRSLAAKRTADYQREQMKDIMKSILYFDRSAQWMNPYFISGFIYTNNP